VYETCCSKSELIGGIRAKQTKAPLSGRTDHTQSGKARYVPRLEELNLATSEVLENIE